MEGSISKRDHDQKQMDKERKAARNTKKGKRSQLGETKRLIGEGVMVVICLPSGESE